MQLSRRISKRIRYDLKHGLMMETLLRQLIRLGLEISCYCVFEEGLSGTGPGLKKGGIHDHDIAFLDTDQVKDIVYMDGRRDSEADFRERLERGDRCLALKIDGRVAGFTWCRFDRFDYPPTMGFGLKENEAYLYDMYIFKAFRGFDLAPTLRYRSYEELHKMGRTNLYSISDRFNTPALRFKNKLGARVVRLCLYVRVGKRFQWNWKLRSYPISR